MIDSMFLKEFEVPLYENSCHPEDYLTQEGMHKIVPSLSRELNPFGVAPIIFSCKRSSAIYERDGYAFARFSVVYKTIVVGDMKPRVGVLPNKME